MFRKLASGHRPCPLTSHLGKQGRVRWASGCWSHVFLGLQPVAGFDPVLPLTSDLGLGLADPGRACPPTVASFLSLSPALRRGTRSRSSRPGVFPDVHQEWSRCGGWGWGGPRHRPTLMQRVGEEPGAAVGGLGLLRNFPGEGQTAFLSPRGGNEAGHTSHRKPTSKERVRGALAGSYQGLAFRAAPRAKHCLRFSARFRGSRAALLTLPTMPRAAR